VAGPVHDEGDAGGLFVEDVLPPEAMFAHHIAMIGGVDDEGVVGESVGVEGVEELADHDVDVVDERPVGGTGAQDHLFGCRYLHGLQTAHGATCIQP